jgi:hypothetical protein
MTMLATMNDARNTNIVPPMLATIATAWRASSPIFGCIVCISPGRSARACDHVSYRLRPTMGQFFTPSRGGGICNVFCCTAPTKTRTESANEFISNQVGTTNKPIPTSVRMIDASPCLPPILRAND